MAMAKSGCGVKARTAVLLWGLVAASLLPSALPVVTRQAASLRRASLAYGHDGDDGLNAGSAAAAGAAGLKPEVVADMGGAAHRGSSSLMAPRVTRKPWDVVEPGAGRASFWGEKSTAGEHEILVRRAGMAAKRAKHPRRGGTGGGSGVSGGGGGSAPVTAAAAPAAKVRTPSVSILNKMSRVGLPCVMRFYNSSAIGWAKWGRCFCGAAQILQVGTSDAECADTNLSSL